MILERTEKHIKLTEEEAEAFVEELKVDSEFTLLDWKIQLKETKESEYYLVSVKMRFRTLAEAKEQLSL